MSIARKVMEEPGRYSIQQLQQAMERGILPAYVAIPLIQEKTQLQKQFQQQQAMQQQPPQSSIAEQVMQEAQMAQAAPGVEGLPSNLPQEYAGGGVVALAGGGDPEDVQAEMDRAEAAEYIRKLKAAGMDVLSLPGRAVAGAAEYGITRPLRALGVPIPYLPKEFYGGDPRSMTPYSDALRRKEEESQPPVMFPTDDRAAASAVQSALADVGGIGAGQGAGKPAGIAGLGAAPMKMPAVSGETRAASTKRIFDEYAAKAKAEEDAAKTQIEAERAKITGKAFEGLEKQLQKEEQERGTEKDQAKAMAIFKAGLAMMAGTSPNAFENIGKGAMIGVEDWQRASKDIKKAEKEHRAMMAQIEQARRAESIGDRDKAISSIEAFRDRVDARNRALASGLANATGKDRDEMFEIVKTEFNAAKALQQAGITAGATLEAAKYRANAMLDAAEMRGEGRGMPSFADRLRAADRVDTAKVTADTLAALGLKEKPKSAAALMQFNKKYQELFDAELNNVMRIGMGSMGTQPAAPATGYPGFKMVE